MLSKFKNNVAENSKKLRTASHLNSNLLGCHKNVYCIIRVFVVSIYIRDILDYTVYNEMTQIPNIREIDTMPPKNDVATLTLCVTPVKRMRNT